MRLRHAQLPEEARDLDKELRALLKEKDAAVRCAVACSETLPRWCSEHHSVLVCLSGLSAWPQRVFGSVGPAAGR